MWNYLLRTHVYDKKKILKLPLTKKNCIKLTYDLSEKKLPNAKPSRDKK